MRSTQHTTSKGQMLKGIIRLSDYPQALLNYTRLLYARLPMYILLSHFLRELGMDDVGVLVPVINAHPHLYNVSLL